MAAKRTAYSLAEMIVVVLILGALSFIAIPHLNFAALNHKQAHAVAKKIVTDLRRTRTLAIANAANNTAGFTLSVSGSSYQIIDDSNQRDGGFADDRLTYNLRRRYCIWLWPFRESAGQALLRLPFPLKAKLTQSRLYPLRALFNAREVKRQCA